MTTAEQVKEIKQSFRQMMDGSVAQSMRNKGVDYKLNWGATLPRLREMADEIANSPTSSARSFLQVGEQLKANSQQPTTNSQYDLAIALWKEDIRECKILATLLMPAEKMLPEVCDIWMEQVPTQEIAEQVAFNLWQYLPYAPEKAYQWLASDKEFYQLCGFHVLTRLFMNGQEPNERGINELLDQALSALQGPYMSVRKAAMQCILRFAELGLVYERMAKSALKSINLEFF